MEITEILAAILTRYSEGMDSSRKAGKIAEKIAEGAATYADALTFSQESGRILTAVLREFLPEALTDGMLYRAIADIVLRKPMEASAKRLIDTAAEVQQRMNDAAGIGIQAIRPEINEDQITGIITEICNAESYEAGKGTLFTQVENFLEGTVDDCVRENADFQYQAGLSPTIERRAMDNCCKWCDSLAGTYAYEDVRNKGNDVFRRHRNCHCIISFNPGNGSKRRQDVRTRQWTTSQDPDIMEQRRIMNLDLQQFAWKTGDYRATMYRENWQSASLKETIGRFARGAKPDKRNRGKTYYTSKDGRYSVVYDRYGDYFRILDHQAERNSEKNVYVDLNGNLVRGKKYNQETHFNNTDKGGRNQ